MTIYVTRAVFQALYAAGLLAPMDGGSCEGIQIARIWGKHRPDGTTECQLIEGERALEFPA